MNEAALRARSLTLADGQVVVPLEDVLALAGAHIVSEQTGEPLDPRELLARVVREYDEDNGRSPSFVTIDLAREALTATPSGGPLDVEALRQALDQYVMPLRGLYIPVEDIAAEYARLTEDAG